MENEQPKNEFHHFQLVNKQGEVPVSISVLVRYNPEHIEEDDYQSITTNDLIAFHDALEQFDGDYRKAIINR